MRITVVTVGSRGDVQPYVALGEGLVDAGHDVLLATHESYRWLAADRELDFTPLVGDPMSLLRETRPGHALRSSGGNWLTFIWAALRLVKPRLRQLWDQVFDACAGADLVLYSYLSFPAYHAAEYHGVPSIFSGWGPTVRTVEFPSIWASRLPLSLGPVGNRLTQSLFEQLAWQPVAPTINSWRRQLGLRPIEVAGLFHRLRRQRHPGILGYSPAVVPTPNDWPDYVHPTGYWFLDPPPDYELPESVATFLDAGTAPLYVGFGSMLHDRPQDATRLVVSSLARAGRRGVLEGFGGQVGERASEFAIHVDGVSHSRLLPRVAAVVHHGGAGTTAAGLRAGRPTAICPFFGDQFFWADRVRKLGAGPAPLPYGELSVERLTRAIEEIAADPGIARRAAAVGDRIAEERGVETAVRLIERYSAGRPSGSVTRAGAG